MDWNPLEAVEFKISGATAVTGAWIFRAERYQHTWKKIAISSAKIVRPFKSYYQYVRVFF